jgi:hypothetical protein
VAVGSPLFRNPLQSVAIRAQHRTGASLHRRPRCRPSGTSTSG